MKEIVTGRLRLRRARIDDLEAVHRILSNADAMRYWATAPHTSLEESRQWLESMIASSRGKSFDFIVEHQGRPIGKAGMFRVPEIGFILHPDEWGRGFAYEALSAIIPAAFARFPIPRIKADVDPRNGPSLKLLERLGFRETGRAENTYFIGGEWCHSVYLARERRGEERHDRAE
ncbi:MAG: GNAT family N-acetyltransferase [Alphaproteobacteria bacterium]